MPITTPPSSLQKIPKPRLAVPYLLPYRCFSPDCKRNMALYRHITFLPSKEEPCPHCKHRGYFRALAVTHLIQESTFGVIKTSDWTREHSPVAVGNRSDFLCEFSKKGYRELPKSPNQPRHYTTEPSAASCFYCLKAYDKVNFPAGNIITEF